MNIGDFVDSYLQRPASRGVVNLVLWTVARWQWLLGFFCFLVAGIYFVYLALVTHHLFWDVNIYAAAAKAMQSGISPYNFSYLRESFGINNPYVYPPFVAQIFYRLSWLLLTPFGLTILLLGHILSWLAIPFLEAGSPANWRSRQFIYVWGLYLVLFGLAGIRLLVVGNIAAILFFVLIFSTVRAVRSGRYGFFWVAIIAASFVKSYLLTFLIFPIVLDKKYEQAILAVLFLAAAPRLGLHPRAQAIFGISRRTAQRCADGLGMVVFRAWLLNNEGRFWCS